MKKPLPSRVAKRMIARALQLSARWQGWLVGADHIVRHRAWRRYAATEKRRLLATHSRLYHQFAIGHRPLPSAPPAQPRQPGPYLIVCYL